MFNSLEEIEKSDQSTGTPKERWLRNAAVLLLTVVLFGGLYAGIKFLE
ncbi:MAG: hypothetical protein ABI759_10585 [Candidatus Solibacter sp.]